MIKAHPMATLPLNDHYVDQESNLNPKYTFDSFVIGPFNELAYTAAQSIIKDLGRVYNPLFVYGNTGHGKTHLIQAVGNYIKSSLVGKSVYYLTSERFYLDFVNAMQANRVPVFKEKYRRFDVIIMDDIQFLCNKDKTQEELFHLFNTLHDGGRQIVFSSDKHPNFIPGLEERLKSRFAAGMIVDIPAPDMDSRLAIIKAKTNRIGLELTEEVTNHLAMAIEGNIREIEGVLNTLICQTQMKGRNLGLLEVKNLVKLNVKPKKSNSVKEVVKAIAAYYDIEENDIFEKTRRKEVVRPRQVAMYILREDCGVSFPLIGEKMGGRDHSTVLHSYEKIKGELKDDTSLEQDLTQIRAML
jgi:chromosomal replication initiator protein